MAAPTIVLSNGVKWPQLGLGTWQSPLGEAKEAVKHAIDVGYRHFDCAWLYGNEKEIGEGIREKIEDGTVKREEIFVTTKLWNIFHDIDQVVPACKRSLENFGLDYIDLYLLHWPVAQKLKGEFDINMLFAGSEVVDHDYLETWKGLEKCHALGLAKSIGVSNFNSKQLERLLKNCTIKPVMNQIEVSPNLNQKRLIKFCRDRGVEITAYGPFGSPTRPWAKPGDPKVSLDDPRLIKIGEKYGKTSAQVILRYILELGTIPIPKSANKERIKKNIDIFDFKLSEEDKAILDSFNCDGRAFWAEELKDSKDYPFKGCEF